MEHFASRKPMKSIITQRIITSVIHLFNIHVHNAFSTLGIDYIFHVGCRYRNLQYHVVNYFSQTGIVSTDQQGKKGKTIGTIKIL